MENEIKKAILPIAGLGTRFLPLSLVLPKELWPLADVPALQYIIEEIKLAGIQEVILVMSPDKKIIMDYLGVLPRQKRIARASKIEKILKERKKDSILDSLKKFQESLEGLVFSCLFQKKPLGDGDAVLQAAKAIGNEPCAVLFGDDIVDAKIPCISQLFNVFKTGGKPVMALSHLPKEKLPSYGVVDVEKIANRLFKVKGIIEKPAIDEAPSDLAVVGKYILTPEVFSYLKTVAPDKSGEIKLAGAFDQMIKDDKIIYGCEFDGRWLECGNKLDWLKSHFYLSLKHPQYGPEIKNFLQEIL